MIADTQIKSVNTAGLSVPQGKQRTEPANEANYVNSTKENTQINTANPVVAYPVEQYPAQQTVADKKLVQKNRAINVLVADPVVLSEEQHLYRSQLNTDENNPFFYDNTSQIDLDMILTAASQQLCRAVIFKILKYSQDSQFKLKNFTLTTVSDLCINEDIIIDVELQNSSQPLVNFSHDLNMNIWIHQNGESRVMGAATWSITNWNNTH